MIGLVAVTTDTVVVPAGVVAMVETEILVVFVIADDTRTPGDDVTLLDVNT
jgi:hypothetical protein